MKADRPASLRTRLQQIVLLPLAITVILGTSVTTLVSYISTSEAFDRALLDDAMAIASQVHESNGELRLALSEAELSAALFDRSEEVYFAVFDAGGDLVAGDARLRPLKVKGRMPWLFRRQVLDDQPLRMVMLRRDGPPSFTVAVALTTRERTVWLRRLVVYALLPQVMLLAILGWWIGRSIRDELAPLGRLQRDLEQRDTRDLTPVDDQAPSLEVASLARALNALMRRVADAVKAQREFAGTVAHELRTPLAGIRALASYGLAREDPQVWRRQLQSIAISEERASRLVDQLLALAFADEARDGLPLQPVALDDLARELLLRYLPLADREGVELGASGLDQPVRVRGQPALIEGALSNLIENAIKHGRPSDGRRQQLSVDVGREGDSVRVAVTDNGPGLAEERREQLLQRWSQGEPRLASRRGSGLGLAIVTRYAALMDAHLSFEAAPGGGLSAVLRLHAA
ncbi:MAG TPA: sensor histidine kinase N-terminal domain-containing protein [Burkholderiaceae bacterium]|nr:sensor histidine kinase N-terminal domain-containing protein [Burkholderiaceae bacterium]